MKTPYLSPPKQVHLETYSSEKLTGNASERLNEL